MEPNNGSAAGNGSANHASSNGNHHDSVPPGDAKDPTTARAEEIVDRWAENISQLTSVWGRAPIARRRAFAKRLRISGPKMQSIRRGEQP